jgi:hypothetical protein
VIARDAARKIEIRFREWSGDLPSHIAISVSTGGAASLVLRPDAGTS